MINKLKLKYRQLHICKDWVRLGSFYRCNKRTRQLINIKNRKPNLIILGAQKCGTTSLFQYLNKHPQIVGSFPQKEPGYFMFHQWSRDFWKRKNGFFLKTKEDMLSNMMYKHLTNEKYFMDASTYYTQDVNEVTHNVPSQIYSESPDSKLVYIIRNPFERLVSNYYHERRKGDLRSFEEISNHTWCINTCLYYDRIKPYIDLFGKDEVHVLTMENLKLNPDYELNQVYNFLELQHYKLDKLDIHNKTSPKSEKPKFNLKTYKKLYSIFSEQERLLNNHLGLATQWNLSEETWVSV